MLESNSPADQEAALRALARRPDLTGRDLIRFARHPDRRVRAAAAAALAPLPGSGPVIRSLLDDGSVIVRRASAAGLARRADGLAILMDVLANGSVRATEAALQSLADTGQTGEGLTDWAFQEVARAAHLRRLRLALATNDLSPTRTFLASLWPAPGALVALGAAGYDHTRYGGHDDGGRKGVALGGSRDQGTSGGGAGICGSACGHPLPHSTSRGHGPRRSAGFSDVAPRDVGGSR